VVGELVRVSVGVFVEVGVSVGLFVGVYVSVGVAVRVSVAVLVAVFVGVAVPAQLGPPTVNVNPELAPPPVLTRSLVPLGTLRNMTV
jgi:hypothetical protein